MSRKLLLKANFLSNRCGHTLRYAHQACGGGRFYEDDRHLYPSSELRTVICRAIRVVFDPDLKAEFAWLG